MPEFWHLYAATVAPDVVGRPAGLNRLKTLAATVGKQATVTVDGKKLASFTYAPDPAKQAQFPAWTKSTPIRVA